MSAAVKLSAALPGEFEVNGVDAQADELVDNPKTLRFGVIWYDTKNVTVDTDTGEHVPTIRIRRLEPLGDAEEVIKVIRAEVDKAFEARTGRTPIPFDIVEITEERYSDTLPEDD